MKNVVATLKYIVKNFVSVLLFAFIPAIFTGVFLSTAGISTFMAKYRTTVINDITATFSLLFNFNGKSVLLFLLSSILVIIFISAFIGNTEYHFRVGKQNAKNLGGHINNNLLGSALYYVLYVFMFMLYKILLGVLLFAVHIIFSGFNRTPTALNYVVACLIIFGLFLLFIFAINYLLLALPITLFSGYSTRTSFSDASELLVKKQFNTALGALVPIVFAYVMFLLGQLFSLAPLFNIIGYFMLFAYLPVYSLTCYYDYAGLKRFDNRGKYFCK